ncbi:hypothetical protein HYS96_00485 [Candidatus Daviesbacteria bacterium]|nr:hypothetical protein [Candidatus Daviesbacteria bacterium]
MKEIVNSGLGGIVRSIAKQFKAIDRMTIAEFVEHARMDGVARVEVMPSRCVENCYDIVSPTFGISLTFMHDRIFGAYYRSYDLKGRIREIAYEMHRRVEYREFDAENAERFKMQSILTGYARVLELRQLLIGVEVDLDLSGFSFIRRPDAKRRQEILFQAQSSGLEPFPRAPIAG